MSTSTKVSSLMVGKSESQTTGNSRKRSALPGEKESKQMKRLLRNRVSAQQARERKKVYMTDLETKTNELEQKNAELLEKVSTLQRENFMLRQIVKNTTLQNNRIASAGGAQTSET